MTVDFNSVRLADGERRTMRVASGLRPKGSLLPQLLGGMRKPWSKPVSRSNRSLTLPIVIDFPACTTFEEALVESLLYFANLPEEGALVIAHGGEQVTYPDAVCVDCEQLDEIYGLSNGVRLQFLCGEPEHATLSELAQLNINTVNLIQNLTGRTGGTAGKLDAKTTTDVGTGFWLKFVNLDDVEPELGIPEDWQLIARPEAVTETDVAAGFLFPLDHSEETNDRVWIRRG